MLANCLQLRNQCKIQLFWSWVKINFRKRLLFLVCRQKPKEGKHWQDRMPLPPLHAGGKKYSSSVDWVVHLKERHSVSLEATLGWNPWYYCHGEIISTVPKWLTESRLKSGKYIANNSSFLCIQGNSWMASGKWLDLNCIMCLKHCVV